MQSREEELPFWEQPEQVKRFAEREPDLRLLAFLDGSSETGSIRALDLGCAGGRNTVLLAKRGVDVTAVDLSRAMVERTRDRLADIVGEEEAETRVRRGPMDDLSWAEAAAFNLVIAFGVYHCTSDFEEWTRALAESARVLETGGDLLVSVFTPRTDLHGEGMLPISGEPHVFANKSGKRSVMMDAPTLDREIERHGLVPAVETAVVLRRTEKGRRETVNGHYRKVRKARSAR